MSHDTAHDSLRKRNSTPESELVTSGDSVDTVLNYLETLHLAANTTDLLFLQMDHSEMR